MDKQIGVHSIDHASYLISVLPMLFYVLYKANYREGISWVESVATSKPLAVSQPLPHQSEIHSVGILGQYPTSMPGRILVNVM